MEPLEILRSIVVFTHIVGFAILFGAWVVEAAGRRFQATRLMDLGLLVAVVSGLALAAPWGLGDGQLNYTKIALKLVVILVIGALVGISRSRSRKGNPLPRWVFWLTGVLILFNAGIAVIW